MSDLIYLVRRLRELAFEAGIRATAGVEPPLDTAEMLTLSHLQRRGAAGVSEIAREVGFAQSRISWAVARLRDERGWVKTETDPADRRSTRVSLQRRAASHVAGVLESDANVAVLDDVLKNASAKDRIAVRHGLDALLKCLRDADVRP